MRFFRLLPARCSPLRCWLRLLSDAHATGRNHAHPQAIHHRHADAHARSHAATVKLAGGALGAGGALSSLARPATAHAADDTSVTIADFQFTPAIDHDSRR